MSEQIKDGIDVSQCECYSVEDNSCNDTLSGSCMKEKCQTFRLLQTIKAKEQECEELREERNEYFELMAIRTEILAKIANKLGMNTGIIENKELFYRINQLKIENEELKKKKEENTTFYLKKYTNKDSECLELQHKVNILKQTLTEIKGIAENMNTECFYDDFDCKYCDMKNGCTYQRKIKILQKISDCEGNNEN